MVLDLACWGFGLSRVMLPPVHGVRESLFDKYGIAYLGWLFDQPCHQQLTGVMASKHYAIYPDLGHAQQVRLMYHDLRLSGELFQPPAVRLENDFATLDWMASRPIDVLYVGNLDSKALQCQWRDRAEPQRPSSFDPRFCEALAAARLSEPDLSLHVSLQQVISTFQVSPQVFNIRFHASLVEDFVRHLYRRNVVIALARSGIQLHIVGNGWGRIELPANVTVVPAVDYEGMFRLAAQAKICLDASTYLDGVNDRAFSYALNRSVCFTNAAGYLKGAVGEEGGMHFYSMGNLDRLCDEVSELLAKPRTLRDLGEQAGLTVRSAHTWPQRIGSILSTVVR